MNIRDVPNDKESFKGKSDMRKLVYATRDDGSYTQVNSEGWEVENMATRQAWDAVEEELNNIRERVRRRELSPVAYHMHRSLMELPVLARYMRKWKWQVKRHFRPAVFEKLDAATLERYASVFNITVEELKQPL